jgi:hypothetical protein
VVLISKLSADKLLVVFTKLIPPFSIAAFPLQKTLGNFTSKSNFMKRLNLIISIILSATIFFTACSKSSDNSTAKTKTQLITQSSWKFDHATAAGFGDVSTYIPSCFKDNVVTFVVGGTGNISEGTDVCSPSYAGTFTWAFQTNETMLHLSAPLFTGGSGDFLLVSLTETNLVVSQSMTIAPFPSTVVEITFKH